MAALITCEPADGISSWVENEFAELPAESLDQMGTDAAPDRSPAVGLHTWLSARSTEPGAVPVLEVRAEER